MHGHCRPRPEFSCSPCCRLPPSPSLPCACSTAVVKFMQSCKPHSSCRMDALGGSHAASQARASCSEPASACCSSSGAALVRRLAHGLGSRADEALGVSQLQAPATGRRCKGSSCDWPPTFGHATPAVPGCMPCTNKRSCWCSKLAGQAGTKRALTQAPPAAPARGH